MALTRRRVALLAVLATLAGAPRTARAWRVRVPGTKSAGPIATGPAGDVFCRRRGAGPPKVARAPRVVRLRGRNGVQAWRTQLRARGRYSDDSVSDVRETGDGDVVVAAEIRQGER